MTSQVDVLREVLVALQSTDDQYMIVGSVAASFHGFSRATHDIDIVISLHPDAVPALASALGDGFYFDEISARRAVERRDMFNIIHMESGVKVDFWILPDDDFSQSQFARRQRDEFEGIEAWVASAEDTILAKLLWYRETPSERQLGDIRAILAAQDGKLDWNYLDSWADRLGVKDQLHQLADEV
jgi:hypothetical protein